MEQRTVTHACCALFFLALSCGAPLELLHAEAPQNPTTVTQADLEAAIKDAESEYKEELSKQATPKIFQSAQIPLAPHIAPKDLALEELAKQVDALANRLIVERTTLLATQSPRKVKVRGARTIFNYSPEALYEVSSALDHITDIELKPGETLSSVPAAGDTVRWNVAVLKSGSKLLETTHIIIKPLDEGIETNLIITTDARTYHLKLKSAEYHMPSVSWNYPEDFGASAERVLKRKALEEQTKVTPEALNFAYGIERGSYAWRPVRVFDDGSKTFIQMPQSMRTSEAPALFLLDEDSNATLVNYRLKGDFYVVDRLIDRAELRVGPKQKLRIEREGNKGFLERLFD